jgi:hypothetical protein
MVASRWPWLFIMYLMFVMVGSGGLMVIAQLAPIANDYKIAGVPVSILGLTLPALTFALTLSGQGAAIRLLRLRCQELQALPTA